MNEREYIQYDAVDLAGLLASGQVTPVELMECAIRLASSVGAMYNAICLPEYDAARSFARQWKQTGPFSGIPFLLKDSGLPSRRLKSNIGSNLFAGIEHEIDATLCQRFETAGLLAFARTTVPELCMAPTTEAKANGGPTLNPYDRTRSSGGSSGGAAVAVAAGIVPVAHASDGGGSIRIPASCCGVFGLKSSRGRIPMGPLRGEGWGGLATDGVLSRTVRDTATALDAVGGYEPGAPYASPVGAPLTGFVLRPFDRPLRIKVWRDPLTAVELAPECVGALEKATQLFASLGHVVESARAPAELQYERFVAAHTRVLAANLALTVDGRLAVQKRALTSDDLEEAMLDGYEVGQAITAKQYAADIATFHSIGRALDRCFVDCDLILTSTLTRPAAPHGELAMRGSFVDFRESVARYSTHLAIVNASGQPAANLPLHWTEAGLPVGVQVIAPFGREDLLVQFASQVEATGVWQPSVLKP
ncbi:amidase [Paraburkholderia acidiphila]|uniref:Amidase n=1 Tax=Paraburkholderia acidiphila TaxID=2571747 RepID=A0A7Z2G712_9BURK|nr:amidase [Paraburkholderia acidiphila]QGZ56388.1 amidase [Paraburkholderia acidiphila]